MNTQEVAQKLISLCRQGQWDQAQEELFAENAVSIEMPGTPFPERCEGKAAIKQKGEVWQSMLEEFHGMEISEPIVAGDHFSCVMTMDTTMKGAPRAKSEEIAVFGVKDGKIVSEQFFYPTQG